MQVFQKKDAVICGVSEALSVLKLGTGRYKDYEKSYKLFDQYIDTKKEARKYFLTDKKKYLEQIDLKIKISEELDSLWVSEFDNLDIIGLKDGDLISPWESVMHIKGEVTSFAHLETVYLGILARRTKIATNVRKLAYNGSDGFVYFYIFATSDTYDDGEY